MPNFVEVRKNKTGQWVANKAETKGGGPIIWRAPEIGYTVSLRENKELFVNNAHIHPIRVKKGGTQPRKTKPLPVTRSFEYEIVCDDGSKAIGGSEPKIVITRAGVSFYAIVQTVAFFLLLLLTYGIYKHYSED